MWIQLNLTVTFSVAATADMLVGFAKMYMFGFNYIRNGSFAHFLTQYEENYMAL